MNNDGIHNVMDIIIMINFTLNQEYIFYADLNDDQYVNVLDIILLINWILGDEVPATEEFLNNTN